MKQQADIVVDFSGSIIKYNLNEPIIFVIDEIPEIINNGGIKENP